MIVLERLSKSTTQRQQMLRLSPSSRLFSVEFSAEPGTVYLCSEYGHLLDGEGWCVRNQGFPEMLKK